MAAQLAVGGGVGVGVGGVGGGGAGGMMVGGLGVAKPTSRTSSFEIENLLKTAEQVSWLCPLRAVGWSGIVWGGVGW